MTKRPCPFDASICRQLKIHVNILKNDLNVLKDVQDKTLKKLLDGSKKLSSSHLVSNDFISNPSPDVGRNLNTHKNYKQKCVTNYFTSNGKLSNENSNQSFCFPEMISKCCFCEREANPTFQCIYCSQFYCSSCSFINYGSFEDTRICISCS